jgi:CBS domain containing-hemolysin-like protein
MRPPVAHSPFGRRRGPLLAALTTWWLAAGAGRAHGSIFQGETLDSIANFISWVVLIVAPAAGIAVFWLIHILPEKIAHKKKHPQTGAIQCLCLLSLCFGGLLWPIAWLWAYTKPVLHKLAYGTDVDESLAHHEKAPPPQNAPAHDTELASLRGRVKELEAKLNSKGGKA